MPITFQTAATAVVQIFAMGAMGFFLVRRGLINEAGLKLLSFLSVNVFFPLFIFNQIMTHFDPWHTPYWWAFPLVNMSMILTGLLICYLLFLRHKDPMKDEVMAIASFHNGGYIPLLLVLALPLGAMAGRIYSCVLLSIIGWDTLLWSLGVWLITRHKSSRIDFGRMCNPPLISMFAAIILVFALGHRMVPEAVLKPAKILGDAALAVAMIVIGGNLSLSRFREVQWVKLSGVVLIKLIALPLITLTFLSLVKVDPLISFVAIIQSCMPSSITLSIICSNYQTKNQKFVNQCIFVTHLLCMITIPIFLGIYGKLFN